MKINNSTKKSLLIIALAMASTTYQTQAAPIEHIGDRYIMHVPEMELTGEESLLDVLMMCPEVISLDGNNIIGGDPFANLYGKFVIRIDNQEYGLDYATFLHHFKAREIETIKVCQNAEVMKGCSSLKKVIDITLRKKENGTTGRWGLFGDTYGGAKGIVSVISQQDKLRVLSHVEGNFQRTSSSDKDAYQGISGTTVNHYSHEGAKLNLLWTPTAKDVLEIDAMQTYTRNHFTHTPADYVRAYHLQADYTRTLADNGSSILFTLGAEHISDNGRTLEETHTAPYQNHSTYPFMVVEYATPVITPDLWITAGFEGGLSIEKNCIADYTNHSNYQDFYAQLDYNIGKWGFMAGDRFRIINFRPKQIAPEEHWKHTTRNHIYSASAYYRFTPGHTLQATYCRRIFNPEFGDFITAGDMEGSWQPVYTADIGNSMANVVELKHTYSRPAFVLSTSVKNIHQHLFSAIHDNTLGIGSTAFWHKGILRLTAGVNYFWQRSETPSEEAQQRNAEYNHFAVFKLAPQLTMADGWRFTGNLIWCTRRRSDPYTPANLYAEVGVYKNLGKHWTLEGRFHDMASQHFGNRAATIGCTYYF